MPRVLIVSPHFPPTNAADMQRVRLVLPYLSSAGWDAEVIAASPECVAAPQDNWLNESIPSDIAVHRVKGLSLAWSRIPGLGQLYPRIKYSLSRRSEGLLHSKRFDLVYFSTTQFSVHTLGPKWKRKYKVPFCMDYQDPWVNDYYDRHPATIPPGGRLKYGIVSRIAKWQEPAVLRQCSGITSVSPDYPKQLKQRYSFLDSQWPVRILPFPCDRKDFEIVQQLNTSQSIFDKDDGKIHWVYIGRGGSDMHKAIGGFFSALRVHLQAETQLRNRLRIHFVGTSYAAAGRGSETIVPLAKEHGLGDIVTETTNRIPYFQTLQCLLDAQALLVIGSDDPSYTASKIYPYLLCGKPLLAIFRAESSVVPLLRNVGGGILVTFDDQSTENSIAQSINAGWLQSQRHSISVPLNKEKFEPYTAQSQAVVLADFFNECLAGS